MGRLADKDDFGNRMKGYEAAETARRLDVTLPVYARIDGRSFSRFTRGMDRPFDMTTIQAMQDTASHLVAHTHARIGYVQSDEISLVWLAEGENSDIFFSGKVQKMVSVLASLAAAKFARVCPPGYEDRLPHFDCRVFGLPSKTEAANAILWRAMDCRKNAIQSVAQSRFSPKQLHGKDQKAMLEMIASDGLCYADYPLSARQGTFLQRRTRERMLSDDELFRIPEANRPDGPVMRSTVEVIAMPEFNSVMNREAVIFDGEEPLAC